MIARKHKKIENSGIRLYDCAEAQKIENSGIRLFNFFQPKGELK
jgi:hypothetical protein